VVGDAGDLSGAAAPGGAGPRGRGRRAGGSGRKAGEVTVCPDPEIVNVFRLERVGAGDGEG
jgi:hypothetical protein